MKKIYLLLLLVTAIFQAQTFNGTTGPISDDATLNNYTATISGLSGPLTSDYGLVTVCVDITHTWDSDLNVHLISPDGTDINLFSALGGGEDNFTGTCLSQSAEASINTGWAPYTGVFKPQETLGNQNNGQSGNGVWTLQILDTYAFADTGSVNSWSITFGTGAATPFVFTSSNLPIVIINTNGVAIPDEPKIDALMGIIDNGPDQMNHLTDAQNGFSGNIGIELRGNYSQGLPQKPYNFETRDAAGEELNVGLLGMPSEHDWCLIANYNDKVFMRNKLAYSLFEQMGNYAARSRYCEVILNGSYQGIYLLMEKIKRDNDRVDIAKLETTENTGINATGGYILKSDYWTWEDSWQLNYHPLDHPDLDVRLVYEYPKPEDITDAQKSYIQQYIDTMETALYGEDFTDPANGYSKYLDVDSFVDYFIVNELARNIDGFRKSWFFSKDKDVSATENSKLKAGPVWDFDWAWKDIWSCSIFEATDGSGWAHLINDCSPDVNSNGWYIRLLQDPAFANRLRCRWETFRASFLSDAEVDAFINNVADELSVAQVRHFEKWGNLGINTGTPEVEQDPATFGGQINQFKNWIALRLAWLDANIPGSAENCELSVASAANPDYGVVAYPNPANTILTFKATNGIQPERVELFDLTGKSVLKVSVTNSGEMNVSGVADGIYVCRILTKNTCKSLKVSILH
ncbi:CotH kinase family protein [Flavobacterium silvaticum]|uniref:T9SS type A sorting domain-containing protein n=1 Tax=Flavobacterium silvaticum TaxID=1852020 RepID=A0A972JEV4_9FLAO|nr:CotH kinase family protein [Flavobacterium silvaticum]NMH26576.1 T9SS type A sorting domain-containing protein [Flavobacterium silvaticum]